MPCGTTARAHAQPDFALADVLGLHFVRSAKAAGNPRTSGDWQGASPPSAAEIRSYLEVDSAAGETPWWIEDQGKRVPLLHLNRCGDGRTAYLAAAESSALTAAVIDRLAGPPPVTVIPAGRQAILTHQAEKRRWILHLMDEGEYTIELRQEHVPAKRVIDHYPKSGWEYQVAPTSSGLQIRVRGRRRIGCWCSSRRGCCMPSDNGVC